MSNPQGTIYESEMVQAARLSGLDSDRYPKRGQGAEPDTWILRSDFWNPSLDIIPVVAWKRLVGEKGDGPRQPDGERRVVVLREKDFLFLLTLLTDTEPYLAVLVQNKWAARLNVTRELGQLVQWIKEHRHGTPR